MEESEIIAEHATGILVFFSKCVHARAGSPPRMSVISKKQTQLWTKPYSVAIGEAIVEPSRQTASVRGPRSRHPGSGFFNVFFPSSISRRTFYFPTVSFEQGMAKKVMYAEDAIDPAPHDDSSRLLNCLNTAKKLSKAEQDESASPPPKTCPPRLSSPQACANSFFIVDVPICTKI